MGPRPGAGILPSPQSSALGAPIGGGSAVLERQQKGRSFVLILSAPEGAYANAALSISLVRKLIGKGIISKEKMSGIVDEAGALLSQGNPIAMRQALQTLRLVPAGHRDPRSDNGNAPLNRFHSDLILLRHISVSRSV
jgi:hypothetical protein